MNESESERMEAKSNNYVLAILLINLGWIYFPGPVLVGRTLSSWELVSRMDNQLMEMVRPSQDFSIIKGTR